MHWMNPSGAWALSALALILCLYILKQKMEPIEVSSTMLWKKAIASMEADRPFQKLKRNALLFLQLLIALLLALSLMRPATLGTEAAEVVFVFDLSASMQADDGAGSRLERALVDAGRRIDGLPGGARVSILTAGKQVSQPLARAADPALTRRTLSSIHAENGGADINGALSLATALARELESVQLIIYTDQQLPSGDYTMPSIGKGTDNRALLSLNAEGMAAVARIANYGAEATVTVECYADGALCDIRTVALPEGETVGVQFQLPEAASRVDARIVEADALLADNARAYVSREAGATTIVIAGRDNIFLEKALALRADVTVLKTTPDEVALVGNRALTVIDGPLPDTLPERGALLLIDPDTRVGDLREAPATLSAAPGALSAQLNAYVQVDAIQVARWRPVTGGSPVWMAGDAPMLSISEENGRRIAVLGFDLHESNLPLLKEFPIFMQRLLSYLAPEPLGTGFEDANCGDTLMIAPQSFARDAAVQTPSGRRVPIAITGGALTDTDEIGVYTLLQTDEDGVETLVPFTLHIPGAESDVRHVASGTQGTEAQGGGLALGREWTPWLVALLLTVTLIEWWVYRRGY